MNLLLVYRYCLSLSKNENVFKTTNESKKTKENGKRKEKKEKVSSVGNRAPDHRCIGSSLYLLRHTMKGEKPMPKLTI